MDNNQSISNEKNILNTEVASKERNYEKYTKLILKKRFFNRINRANDYSLVSGRYVGIDDSNEMSKEEVEEQIKIVSNELKDLLKENQELAKKVEEILDM